jgi:heme exporter protein D
MTLEEFFSFLPYGKYAFYVWFSYLTTVLIIGFLFIRTYNMRKHTLLQLQIKYEREYEQKTK